jgi:2-keto-4-pentenoate hydratase/2-oxohepta-3-ene-1,7-dioic acid hydratase in catechol pathway
VSAGITESWRRNFGIERPGKIVCVGLNYARHTSESGFTVPAAPLLFGKFANTLVGDGEPILVSSSLGHVDAEAELAVVIGTRAKGVSVDDALEFVQGYTVANDVSARELQFSDGQWFRGKGLDSFCPLHSELVSVADLGEARGLRVVQRLNGEVLQDGNTSDLIFGVRELVAYISRSITLDPGDVVLTGTPDGVGYFREPKVSLRAGDRVTVEVEGVGVLSNPVVGVEFAS